MPIKIEYEKIVVNGENRIRVTGLGCLVEDNLPTEYVQAEPHVWLTDRAFFGEVYINCYRGVIYIKNQDCEPLYLYIGQDLNPDEFGKYINIIKICGDRLTEINKHPKPKKKWEGSNIIEI